MIKVSLFQGETEHGPTAVPLFGPADTVFEKVASPNLLPEVVRYIDALRPEKDAQYVLVNAMGASEYFGSNINGDAFPEASLIHKPDDWTGNPLVDRVRAKDWAYGFPTFYLAHPYLHHRNKDASRAYGEVELAAWHPRMKRVELVVRVDKDKCEKFGGLSIWDKLKAGQHPDVSMGTKVPYDTCSICLDWNAYRDAQATFDKRKHKSPGDAVLEVHKRSISSRGKGIRGVSITRKDYCEHALKQMNRILADGRKVFVYNDYPKFFDISFVFIGADKTAKTMMKIAGDERKLWSSSGSAELAEKVGYAEDIFEQEDEDSVEKVASVQDFELKHAFLGKEAKNKKGEIVKDVVPSQLAGKAVPLLTKNEPDIPDDLLDVLGGTSLEESLSTPTGLGIVLRPREFQRIMLIQIGRRDLADDYNKKGIVFPRVAESEDVPMGAEFFNPILARLLSALMASRSGLGPSIEKRVVIVGKMPGETRKASTSHSSTLLHKIGAAYTAYRNNVMDLVANSQELISSPMLSGELAKLSHVPVSTIFTPLSFSYFNDSFWDEVGVSEGGVKTSGVERGSPSRNTRANHQSKTGGVR